MNSEQMLALERVIESAQSVGFNRDNEPRRQQAASYLKIDRETLISLLDRERPASTPDVEAIRARTEAATPGPWAWWGEADANYFHLCTAHSGREFVMGFARAGMQNAQPMFRSEKGYLEKGKDLAIYEVAPKALSRNDPNYNVYRGTVIGFRSPDAAFIASARADVDLLLDHITTLERELANAHAQIEAQAEQLNAAFDNGSR